jgi:methylated-DNA-[protein]-cysteine S-methyltransferase
MASPQSLIFDFIPTPAGAMRVVTDEQERVRALDWEDYEERFIRLLHRHHGMEVKLHQARLPSSVREPIQAYLAGDLFAVDAIPVATAGTAFQQQVWAELRCIRPGTTLSYAALAARIGRPSATRAVGLANGANPIGVVVPCHRVIGTNGSLTGFGGGLDRKRWLLEHEGALLQQTLSY